MAAGTLAPAAPISIIAPASVVAGTVLCFDVVALSGINSVIAEINDVSITLEKITTGDPNVTRYCGVVPAGSAGSTVVITAVAPGGTAATARVAVI